MGSTHLLLWVVGNILANTNQGKLGRGFMGVRGAGVFEGCEGGYGVHVGCGAGVCLICILSLQYILLPGDPPQEALVSWTELREYVVDSIPLLWSLLYVWCF